jgi:hypothetical protein
MMTAQEKYEIVQRVAQLPVVEQLALIEELIRNLRRSSIDREAIDQQMDAMVSDPGIQRVIRNEDLIPA